MNRTFAARQIVPIAVLVLLSGISGGVLLAASNVIAGLRDDAITDSASGRQFLIQEVDLFLPDRATDITGTFEYLEVPGSVVVDFQAQQGIVEEAWVKETPARAIVLGWTSPNVTFQAPHPRPGVDATLHGDTFLIILVPGEGRKIEAVVSSGALAMFGEAAVASLEEPLTLASTK